MRPPGGSIQTLLSFALAGNLALAIGCSHETTPPAADSSAISPSTPSGSLATNTPPLPVPASASAPSGAVSPADSTQAAALESAMQEHLAALGDMESLLRRATQSAPIRISPQEFTPVEQRLLASHERLKAQTPTQPPRRLSHEPTALEAVTMRYRNEHLQRLHSVLGALRNLANVDNAMKPQMIALADRLEMRPHGGAPIDTPATPADAVAVKPLSAGATKDTPPSISFPAESPRTIQPRSDLARTSDGKWILKADEFHVIQKDAGRKQLPFENNDPARVTGIVASLSLREGIKRMTLAAGDSAISVWFAGNVDLSKVQPLHEVAIEGRLSIVTGVDNLPSVMQVGQVTIESEALAIKLPEVFLAFDSTAELAKAAAQPGFKDENRLIATMSRPIVVSGKVQRVETFRNEFLQDERLIMLDAASGVVVCRFGRDADAAKIRGGDELRIVALLDLGFHPGRPRDEVWLKDAYLYPSE